MLQQTRTAAVLAYYRRFLRVFPSLRALAQAPTEAVLRAWAGLGYYSRARNLHRAARQILREYSGRFPSTMEKALALPGVGEYTARAVLSIACDKPVAVLDGNVARVIARREVLDGNLRAPARWKQLQRIADRWLAREAPGDWNQAMMELGATVCTPRSPRCGECPVREGCGAFALGLADTLPAPRQKRAPVRMRIGVAVLVDEHGRALLVRPRTQVGEVDEPSAIFSRMWQFPAATITNDARAELEHLVADCLGLRGSRWKELPRVRHRVTYREITLEPWLVQVTKLVAGNGNRIVELRRVPEMAVSSASRKIARAAMAGSGPFLSIT